MTKTSTCHQELLENVFEAFPGYLGLFDAEYHLEGGARIAVTIKEGHVVSYSGPEGMMVIHRNSRGDITFTTCPRMGSVEGVIRHTGVVQGVDEVLPDKFRTVLETLARSRALQN